MKIMIFDQGGHVAGQLASKASQVFASVGSTGGSESKIVVVKVPERNHGKALGILQDVIEAEKPELLLIGATALGEEIAPALGIRLGVGVAAHCIDMKLSGEGELVFMIPAFGGRVIGEIMIPEAEPGKPAIATVKPDIFTDKGCGEVKVREIEPEAGENTEANHKGFRLVEIRPRQKSAADIGKAELILCGGFGIGSEESWQKLEKLAEALRGAAGCTRPVVDAGWGPDEASMIGTSGRSVKPKVYVGFGISGAAHHMCGIKDADMIININRDKNADVFKTSDYIGVFDANKVLDALEKEIGECETAI